jgi:hypothetical protein
MKKRIAIIVLSAYLLIGITQIVLLYFDLNSIVSGLNPCPFSSRISNEMQGSLMKYSGFGYDIEVVYNTAPHSESPRERATVHHRWSRYFIMPLLIQDRRFDVH